MNLHDRPQQDATWMPAATCRDLDLDLFFREDVPGLTCATCEARLYPHEARRTPDGFVHLDRAACAGCKVDGCQGKKSARGYCRPHYHRWLRHGDPLGGRITIAETLEDIEFMADTGESLVGAAARLGLKRATLGTFLGRNGRHDLTRRLAARDSHPGGAA